MNKDYSMKVELRFVQVVAMAAILTRDSFSKAIAITHGLFIAVIILLFDKRHCLVNGYESMTELICGFTALNSIYCQVMDNST